MAPAILALPAAAQDAGLQSLETGDQGRDWLAVGRLEIGGTSFCTGTLIAPDRVLTAAHCMFDRQGRRVDPSRIEFRAGLRNGRAEAYRNVRRAVTHPDYEQRRGLETENVRNDVALLELARPIRLPSLKPFATDLEPRRGARVGVVSYAQGRAEAPSLQEICAVLGEQSGVLVLSCQVEFGASGSPVFTFDGGEARVVSVISAKAHMGEASVALATRLAEPLARLEAELAAGRGSFVGSAPRETGFDAPGAAGQRRQTGAKFLKVE